MNGMKQVMQNLRRQAHPAFPIAIYYAFKQSQTAAAGKVQLQQAENYSPFNPNKDMSNWQALHHIAAALQQGHGVAGEILAQTRQDANEIINLAHRLYTVCERKRWSKDSKRYNSVVANWDKIGETADIWRRKGGNLLR